MSSQEMALVCQLYPKTADKQQRILSLLQKSARDYYRDPSAKCTTWSYFTQFPPPKSDANRVVGGLEIYTEKKALQAQVDDPVHFQSYHKIVKDEDLYAKDEQLVAWYLTKGFVARGQHAPPFGGVLISQTRFVCKDRDTVLKLLDGFVPFVRDKEPDVLTYAAFTRPKAPNEVLLIVRYKDKAALKSHSGAPEHVDVVKKMMKHITNDMSKATTLWQEIEDSFVSKEIGGPSGSAKL